MVLSALEDDLDVIFETEAMGTLATVSISATSEVKLVKGIFDNGDVPTDNQLADVVDAYVRQTTFTCASSAVTDLAVNDTLLIDAVTYYHAFAVSDGTGTIEIHLSTEAI